MTETMTATRLAEGPGWFVQDMVCTAAPEDAPFEQQHGTVAVAAVLSGTFFYRSARGKSLLVPGSVLLGNHGHCFECGHEHSTGDRCLSFHFSADCWEEIAGAVPGRHGGRFEVSSLPPETGLIPVMAMVETTLALGRPAMEDIAFAFAGTVLGAHGEVPQSQSNFRPFEERRVAEAVQKIERSAHELENTTLSLAALARDAGMSRYHFLRTFRRLVGTTPHQYVLQRRMSRAATRIRTTNAPLSDIALESGFSDLSTFIRRFRAVMGTNPGSYRRGA